MTWLHYSAGAIRVRQQKTETVLDVALHPALAAHLDRLVPDRNCLTIVADHGRPVPYLRFNERFRRITKCAGIDAQARDLRRTAIVEMAKAGATIPQIASVSGHSIEATSASLRPICRATASSPRSPSLSPRSIRPGGRRLRTLRPGASVGKVPIL
jgi:hypothetical protein